MSCVVCDPPGMRPGPGPGGRRIRLPLNLSGLSGICAGNLRRESWPWCVRCGARALGRDWRQNVNSETLYELLFRGKQDEASANAKPVVLSKVLKHPSNVDFGVGTRSILAEVNGQSINSMRDLKAALEHGEDDFHRFRFLSGREEALSRSTALAADKELLKQYNIPAAYRLEQDND